MEDPGYSSEEHSLFLEERKALIEAARESARTFDQAVLAFGSAVFGASIAFLKDVAPKPQVDTVKWLALSWACFSLGLLGVLLSFLFSHRACMFEIEEGQRALGKSNHRRKKNRWASATTLCNILCVCFLFTGLLFWSVFAVKNLRIGDSTVSNAKVPQTPQKVERGYVPPPPPPKAPPPPPTKK